jgi:tetratricopeptide (TPR) repeat protein
LGEFFNRGTIYRLKHEWDEAVPDYAEALRLNPTNALVYKNRAALYDHIGNFKGAIQDWNKGIRLEPNDPDAFVARGRARQNTGDYEGAKQDFDEGIRLDPRDASAYNNLAWLNATCPSAQLRNGALAVKAATKACELTSWADWKKIDTLAAACAEAGDFGKAINFQRRAIKLLRTNGIDQNIALQHLRSYEQMQPIRALGESQF